MLHFSQRDNRLNKILVHAQSLLNPYKQENNALKKSLKIKLRRDLVAGKKSCFLPVAVSIDKLGTFQPIDIYVVFL